MRIIAVLIVAAAIGLVSVESSHAVNFVCGRDLNGNGTTTDPGETGQCATTPQGELCPVGAVNCVATYTPPICPPGGALDSTTNLCTASHVPQWRNWIYVELAGANGVWNFQASVDLNGDGIYDRIVGSPSSAQDVYAFYTTAPVLEEYKRCDQFTFGLCPFHWSLRFQKILGISFFSWYSVSDPGPTWWQVNRSSPTINRQTAAGYVEGIVRQSLAINPAEVRLQAGSEAFFDGTCFGIGSDRCYSAVWERAYQVCPTGYSETNGVCQSPLACSTGTFNSAQHACYQGDSTCPLGSQFICMDNAGTYQCSSNSCVDLDAMPPTETTPNLSSYQNNGTADPSTGLCEGPVFIFNGKGSQCRSPGAETSFFNCCSSGSGDFLVFKKYCADSEWTTDTSKDAGACHSIGEYCKTNWPLVGCVQKAEVYCCFNSKLGRMIQEQGRGQLRQFAPDGQWGTADNPNCVGFTPEQMSMLDFSRMDLSEYFANISSKPPSQIDTDMGNKINDFYGNLHP